MVLTVAYDAAKTAATQTSVNDALTQATLARKYATNKAIIASDDLSFVIYEDDGVTPIRTTTVSADKRVRTPI
jgi:hypothetical protein